MGPIAVSPLIHREAHLLPIALLGSVYLIIFGALLLGANVSGMTGPGRRSRAEAVMGAILIIAGAWFLLPFFMILPFSPAYTFGILPAVVVMGILAIVAIVIIIIERGLRKR